MKNISGFFISIVCLICSANVYACYPGANEVTLHEHGDFGGKCWRLSIGNYSSVSSQGIWNDAISSIRVGSNVTAELYRDSNFGGNYSRFASNVSQLSRYSIGNDTLSSIRVWRRGDTHPCNPSSTQITLFEDNSYRGRCWKYPIGNFSSISVGDRVSSVKVGSGVNTELYEHINFGGSYTDLSRSRYVSNLGIYSIGNDRLSSLRVYAYDQPHPCAPYATQISLFEDKNYRGRCWKYSIGNYDSISVGDTVTSVKVGSKVNVELYENTNYGGGYTDLSRSRSIAELSSYSIGNDRLSSIRIYAYDQPHPCAPSETQVTVFEHKNYRGRCWKLAQGSYPNIANVGVPGDEVTSIKVGSDAQVELYENIEFEGEYSEFSRSRALSNLESTNVGNDRLSSARVYRYGEAHPCDPSANHVTLFTKINYRGQCKKLAVGRYGFVENIGLLNDRTESVKINGNLAVGLSENDNYGGKYVEIERSYSNIKILDIGNGISSIEIWPKCEDCKRFTKTKLLMRYDKEGLRGLVDMHAHPMSYLGFGSKIVHGAPDIGSLIPKEMYHCNDKEFYAGKIEQALPNCETTHGGIDFIKNLGELVTTQGVRCADLIRHDTITNIEKDAHSDTGHGDDTGYPDFRYWPSNTDVTHQTMWVDWIKRAWRGGLSVMVSLAVNNETLATVVNGQGLIEFEDGDSARLQISEMKALVKRHDFMEIAYSPEDLRRIVDNGKLAIILGVEVDDFMDLGKGELPTENEIRSSVSNLYDQGVRYIFPVHLTDNAFAGAALYKPLFAYANRYQTGNWFDISCDNSGSVSFRYSEPKFESDLIDNALFSAVAELKLGIQIFDLQKVPSGCNGAHVNAKGLSVYGRIAIDEMMRKGMMIDIDHMSERTVSDVILMAHENRSYPLNSGHNGLRSRSDQSSENSRTLTQYRYIAESGGMAGLGWSSLSPCQIIGNIQTLKNYFPDLGIAFGTDANGLEHGPIKEEDIPFPINLSIDSTCRSQALSRVHYSDDPDDFPRSRTGRKQFDYNIEGVSHYGLMADLILHMNSMINDGEVNHLFEGAEKFALMWEKSDALKE